MTAIAPVCCGGMWSLRYTRASGGSSTACAEVTGPMRRIIGTASAGSAAGSPESTAWPGATVRWRGHRTCAFRSAVSRVIRPKRISTRRGRLPAISLSWVMTMTVVPWACSRRSRSITADADTESRCRSARLRG